MNASSESGECARVMVSVIMCPSDDADAVALHAVVDCVTFDRLETGFFDQADQFSLGHLYFVVSFDGITGGQLATFRDCAVDIVRAVMQCDLRQTFAEHYPVRFDVIEVV